ncbi:MAG: FixH family protein [Sphingomonadales bacterium]|jgi:nitrogen fixation protein FixH|nr:FixH family protein [Sphingomonadales bacterium]MBK9002340.1 FixH family protein [Sphingomonadales bacterium]MBK9267566.1 FixH family protein [Sphingomonadales bacterium]MBP6433119.1 FixH family protein [Sphingorhabdus sp.]
MKDTARKPFTGYHIAAILIGFFGIVIAVNIYMAKVAIGTFGGTVVDNSYVASQQYNEWLAEAEKQAKLGWAVEATRLAGGKVRLAISEKAASGLAFEVTAKAQHPLGRAPEQALRFEAQGDGSYVSRENLPSGRSLLHIEVRRGSDLLRTVADIP